MLRKIIVAFTICISLVCFAQQEKTKNVVKTESKLSDEEMKDAVIKGEWKTLADNLAGDAISHFSKAVANGVIGNYRIMYEEFEKSKTDKNAVDVYCTEMIKQNPENGYAYFFEGVRLYDIGETEKAISLYKKASELNSNFAAPLAQIGIHYGQKEGNYSQQLLWIEKAIKADNNYYPAYYAKGWAYNSMGNQNKAIEQYKKTIEILEASNISKGQSMAESYYNIGWIYLNQTPPDNEKGIIMLEKAISADPYTLEAYTELGIAYKRKGEYAKAIKTYKNGIDKGNKEAKIYFNLGVSEYRNGNNQGAKTAFQKAISLDKGGQIGTLAKQWLGQIQ